MCVPMSSSHFLLTLLYCFEFLLFASFRNRHSFAPTRTALTSRWACHGSQLREGIWQLEFAKWGNISGFTGQGMARIWELA